jgi:hypothetical protein
MKGPDQYRKAEYRKAISCIGLRSTSLPLFEDRLPADERERLEAHINECASCSEQLAGIERFRRVMKSLPVHKPPAEFSTRLRVIASRESYRRRSRVSWKAWWHAWKQDTRLWMNNLMRPLAIPTAGGFFSAVLLFGVLAHSIAPGVTASANDIPTVLYTGASVKSFMPLGFEAKDLTVEITLDENGRLIDYSIPDSAHPSKERAYRAIENLILFTQFTPASRFGRPISGKVKINFLSSRIDVKG